MSTCHSGRNDHGMSEQGVTVARIQIERLMMPDGDDIVSAQFDDGDDEGDMPALVELLGMLELAKDTAIRLAMGGDCDHDRDDE